LPVICGKLPIEVRFDVVKGWRWPYSGIELIIAKQSLEKFIHDFLGKAISGD